MADTRQQLGAEVRKLLGRKVKKLRSEGLLPASIYGKGFKSLSVQVKLIETKKLFDEVGESKLVDLKVADTVHPVLFRNPQIDPVSSELLHVDFYRVNLKEKITAMVPVDFAGEAPAVKDGNLLITVTDEVEVEALPTDLPEKFIVDISGLTAINQMLTVADIVVDKTKVEITTPADQVLAKIEEPKEEVEEAPAPAEEVTPAPATEQKAPEEAQEEKKEE